ncbi:hypothetical protein ISS30_10570 [bacterium]|nr:hypothetical protein [bacterium]
MILRILYFLILYLLLTVLVKKIIKYSRARKERFNRYSSPADRKRYRPGEIEDADFEEINNDEKKNRKQG